MKSTNASSKDANKTRTSTGSASSLKKSVSKTNFVLTPSSLAPSSTRHTDKSPKNSSIIKTLPEKQLDKIITNKIINATAHVISVNSKASPLPPSNNYVAATQSTKRTRVQASPTNSTSSTDLIIDESAEEDNNENEEELIDVDLLTPENPAEVADLDTSGFTTAGAKKSHPKAKRLPAIRVRIANPETAKFNNNNMKEKAEELKRCFPNRDLSKIKFVEFNRHDPCTLLIATDDATTHEFLSDMNNWPNDAFGRGVKSRKYSSATAQSRTQTYTFSLTRVPTNIDVESEEIAAEFLKLGFSKVVRTINSTTNAPSQFLRLYTDSKEVYSRHVYQQKPVTLYWSNFYAKPDTRPLQCFKCQGLGHVVFDCPSNKPRCLKCGLEHELKNCPDKTDKVHCVNCASDDHVSCSRKCPAIRAHVKEKEEKKAEKSSDYQQKQQQKPKGGGPSNPQHQKTASRQQSTANNRKSLYSKAHEPARAVSQPATPEAQPDRPDLAQKIEDLQEIVFQLLEIIKGFVPETTINAILNKNKPSVAAPQTMTSCSYTRIES
jgi:hypothetical protein